MYPDLIDVLSAAGDIGYDWDVSSDVIHWHGAWDRLFPTTEPPRTGKALFHAIHPDDRHLVFNADQSAFDREFRISSETSGYFWIHERGAKEVGAVGHKRGIWRIIEEPRQGAPSVEQQNRDSLTGCFKRRVVQTELSAIIETAKTPDLIGAYLVISVDNMSFVNDAVGTEAGDSVLRSVAARLGKCLPAGAILGRVNGDVFGIVLPPPMGHDLQGLAERIIDDFRNTPVGAANSPLHITVSTGGVRLPLVAKNASEGMLFAEEALHAARQNGRNSFVEYVDNPERVQENRHILELSERIKRAFKIGGFRLAYQPIVAAASGNPVCYEALVRMFDDEGKPVAAAAFVPLIEQLGLAVELDKMVLDLAVRDMEADPDLSVAINISGVTASQADWPEYIRKVLSSYPTVAKRLIVEVTETAAIVNIAETQRFVSVLRDLGGRVSLDDFGAGATSIRYLRELGLSIMKIDKGLLDNVTTDREQQHLVRVLIDLAHGLNIQVVAEGIETPEMAAWLRDTKVDYMQGYYFGKPALGRPPKPSVSADRKPADSALLTDTLTSRLFGRLFDRYQTCL